MSKGGLVSVTEWRLTAEEKAAALKSADELHERLLQKLAQEQGEGDADDATETVDAPTASDAPSQAEPRPGGI